MNNYSRRLIICILFTITLQVFPAASRLCAEENREKQAGDLARLVGSPFFAFEVRFGRDNVGVLKACVIKRSHHHKTLPISPEVIEFLQTRSQHYMVIVYPEKLGAPVNGEETLRSTQVVYLPIIDGKVEFIEEQTIFHFPAGEVSKYLRLLEVKK